MDDHLLEQAAKELRGNWKRFDSFAWSRRDVDQDDWGIVYTHDRDSGNLKLSNAHVIYQELRPFLEAEDPDILEEDHTHWAHGWVKGYAIRPLKDGKITDAFRKWMELTQRRMESPVLDEEHYAQVQKEDALSSIGHSCEHHLRDDPPDEWEEAVYKWLWENRQHSLEPDDQGGVYVDFRDGLAALQALELLDPDDMSKLRDVNVGGYRLQTWDTEARDRYGKFIINYRFSHPDGWCLFAGDDFACTCAIDSDECLRSLLGFLTLRPGDTDAEYFESYSPSQMEFAEGDAEELQLWSIEPDGECEAMPFEDWEDGDS